jgi:hypothetical protein
MIAVAQSHVLILTGRIMAGLAVGLSSAPGQVGNLPAHSNHLFKIYIFIGDRLCGLVVRVPGYISRGHGFDTQRHQIFCEVVKRGPLSLVRIIEELLEWESSGSGLGNRD